MTAQKGRESRWESKWKQPRMVHAQLTKYNWLPYYPKNIHLGYSTDIGAFCLLQGKFGIWIGDYSQLGAGCLLYTVDSERGITGPIRIGTNTRIGAQVVIFPNVVIGDDCFVDTGCVLNNITIKDGSRVRNINQGIGIERLVKKVI